MKSSVNFCAKIGMCTYFKIEKFNYKNEIVQESKWYHNKMTNVGLDNIRHISYDNDYAYALVHCQIGTGTSLPDGSDTELDAPFSETERRPGISYSEDPPRVEINYNYFQWNVGTFDNTNIGEFGLRTESPTTLFNRQLTRVTSTVEDEVLATGDGTTTNFTGTLANGMCDTESLTIIAYDTTDTLMTLTDDGSGNLSGDGSGTILYNTGGYDITFNNPVKNAYNITADYTWQEPTTITVKADEGLRIYAKLIHYLDVGKVTPVTGSFTLENITDSTNQTVNYEKILHDCSENNSTKMIDLPYVWINKDYAYDNDSVAQTFTSVASGGPYYDLECTWNAGSFTGTISSFRCSYGRFVYVFDITTTIPEIIDTEVLKFTFRLSWEEA